MIHIDKILSAEKENAHIEAKAATGGVPQSMWETYSAFANTNGGVILLGVKEDTHSKKLIPVGVENPEKLISEIWNILHNAQKISENILLNENIYAINYRNMQLIVVEVPRAARQNRPVYLGRDMFTGTFRRSGEGDYRCKREEILAMLRDQTEEGVDSKVVESLMPASNACRTDFLRRFRHDYGRAAELFLRLPGTHGCGYPLVRSRVLQRRRLERQYF